MDYLSLFKMPKPVNIAGRSSTITNSFINSIIPVIVPSDDEVKEALEILGMNHGNYECSYCGSTATEWDHLRPLVLNKLPTGYISEIHNLVPACGKCNQSKGNKHWETWIQSNAKLSPKSRNVKDIELRVARLKKYEEWRTPTKVDFEKIVGSEKWQKHWENYKLVQSAMSEAQVLASEINRAIASVYAKL